MHSVSPMDNLPLGKEANGHGKQSNELDSNNNNGLTPIEEKKEQQKHKQQKQETTYTNGNSNDSIEKIVLPVEMASMVPLRTLVGKMINKAHAELINLTETLPSMSDVERKRQILNYTTFTRTQFLKLMVLVKWADNADDVQMCQNIMAFLANQNKTFQDTVDYLHKIHIELPAARVRNFDILTAVDVLTTGTYQRMPTKIEDMLPLSPLTDREVLETFAKMNDEIRVRMLTKEILPSTMLRYRIANGRVYFCVNNEFDVSLTLMGNSDDRKWWIVSLDVLVQPSPGGSASDVDISLNEVQRQRLRANAQRQLVPPELQNNESNKEIPATDTNASLTNIDSHDTKAANEEQPNDRELFFPLVNLYDYLHLFCLNMQLEIVYMQATMMAKTQWLDQLMVHMNSTRTSLTLLYWGGGSPAAHWGSPQQTPDSAQQSRSTTIEISISNEDTKRTKLLDTSNKALSIAVRDEYKSLIQKSGIGASVALASLDEANKSKVYNSLKYPKTCLEILWSGSGNLYTSENLLDSTDMNIEKLLLHVTTYHKQSILDKFRQLLKAESTFLEANGLELVDDHVKDNSTDTSFDGQPLVIRYRHDRYIYIDFDSRVGRVKVCETGKNGGDGNTKLNGLEDRLNSDPTNIGRHLLWLRSEVVIHEIVSLAKQLNLQPLHPSQMLLRSDDMTKLFGDLPTTMLDPAEIPPSQTRSSHQQPMTTSSTSVSSVTSSPSITGRKAGIDQTQQHSGKPTSPQHFVFLQFSQFEDWYLVIAVIKNEFLPSLCCLRKINDQNAIYQEFVDLIHVDHEQVWNERFASGRNDVLDLNLGSTAKPQKDDTRNDDSDVELHTTKRRRTMTELDLLSDSKRRITDKIDNLSIDLPFLAKLESLSRAFITNRKIELQLNQYRTIRSYTRPFIKSLSGKETRTINHPSADRMEVLCVSQSDLLRTCALRNVDIHTPNPSGAMNATPRMDFYAWVESIAPRMTNEVMLRSSGWWSRGRRQCFVEIQVRVDWGNIPMKSNKLSDHITMDSSSNMLSFIYNDVDLCVDQFLMDWERIFMMANLSRQVSSIWLRKYGDQLSFDPCDMRILTFTYAKDFVCTIRWSSPGKGHARRYMVNFTTNQDAELVPSTTDKKSDSRSNKLYLTSAIKRNPHWRVIAFLQDVLNDKRDLVYFVQVLFQTLPLMASLEQIEESYAQKGEVGQVCIIPRASDSVRIMFSTLHGIDIHFQDPSTICISDAAFHHAFYRTLQKTPTTKNMYPPSPYIPPSASNVDQKQADKDNNSRASDMTPIKVAQQMICKPFVEFDRLLEDVDQWIFSAPNQQDSVIEGVITNEGDGNDGSDGGEQQPWYLSGQYCWVDAHEPTFVSFDHGLLCSASLCRNVLFKLQHSYLKNSPLTS